MTASATGLPVSSTAFGGFAPDVRWVRPESLHVTLKFIGEKLDEDVAEIKAVLETIVADPVELIFRGYGFFPGARAPRVFWVGIEAEANLNSLASMVDEKLAPLGIPREEHAFKPHLTLARGGGGSASPRKQKSDRPNCSFEHLQERLGTLPAPEFGTMTAREFFLYQSRLSPGGSKYTKIERFDLP